MHAGSSRLGLLLQLPGLEKARKRGIGAGNWKEARSIMSWVLTIRSSEQEVSSSCMKVINNRCLPMLSRHEVGLPAVSTLPVHKQLWTCPVKRSALP